MEWLGLLLAGLFAAILFRSLIIVCFPGSDLATWLEVEFGWSDLSDSCGDGDGGGDGGSD